MKDFLGSTRLQSAQRPNLARGLALSRANDRSLKRASLLLANAPHTGAPLPQRSATRSSELHEELSLVGLSLD